MTLNAIVNRPELAQPEGRAVSVPAPDCGSELAVLRFAALRCRAQRRDTLWSACAMLSPDGPAQPLADTLLSTLGEALGKPPVFYAPQEVERSFDEAWLLRVFECQRRGDCASVEMLIRSRLRPASQRLFRMLVSGLADRLHMLH